MFPGDKIPSVHLGNSSSGNFPLLRRDQRVFRGEKLRDLSPSNEFGVAGRSIRLGVKDFSISGN